MRDLLVPAWFYRRPLFWWALASMSAVLAADCWNLHPFVWISAGFAAPALLLAGQREAGMTLAVACLFGCLAARAAAPPVLAGAVEGGPLTVRGVLRAVKPAGEQSRAVLDARRCLTRSGWTRCAGRLGLSAPPDAREGDLVEVSGRLESPLPAVNPGGFDARRYWLDRGTSRLIRPHALGYRRLGRVPLPAWREAARSLRGRILAANRASLSPRAAFIANSFVVGETEDQDSAAADEVLAAFRDSGTVHLLVVSGSQVMLVLGLFLWLGWRFYPLRLPFWALGWLAVIGYYFLTDGDAAVSRAAVMGGVVALGMLLSREPDLENSLGAAVLALLAWNPYTLFNAGFMLSAAAVWSLGRLAPVLSRALVGERPPPRAGEGRSLPERIGRTAADGLAASAAAHLATAPIVAMQFQRATWIGIVANLPMALGATFFALVAAAHALLACAGISLLAPVVEGYAQALHAAAAGFARVPGGAADVFPTPAWMLPFLFGALAAPSLLPRLRPGAPLLAACLAAALLLSNTAPAPPPSAPTLRALDVGQGDAVLLQSPAGANILVDGGGAPDSDYDVGRAVVLPALRALRVGGLDALVMSHADEDHAGGLASVAEQLPVRLVVQPPYGSSSPGYRRLQEVIRRRRLPVWTARAGDVIRVRDGELSVLGPPLQGVPGRPDDLNENSLVLRWDCRGARFLLPGDAEVEGENAALAWGPGLRADVLKVGHHGSRTSTQDSWLRAVRPAAAVISCGRRNRFGHPAPEVLDRLRAAGVRIARTDQGGMVTVRISRGKVELETYLPRR